MARQGKAPNSFGVKSLNRLVWGAQAPWLLVWAPSPEQPLKFPHSLLFGSALLHRTAVIAIVFSSSALFAGGVVLDGSFGASGALPGPNYMISASFGKTVGNNL